MDWLPYAGIVAGVAILLFAFRNPSVPPSQRGVFIGTGLASLVIGSWMLLQLYVPGIYSNDLASILFLILSLLLYGSLAAYPFVKKAAGELLMATEKPASRKYSSYATAGLFTVLFAFTITKGDYSREKLTELLFYSSVIVYFGLPLLGKIEFCEKGIVESYTLFRWETMSAFRWDGPRDCTLTIDVTSGLRKSMTLILTPEVKESVTAMFEKRLHRSPPA